VTFVTAALDGAIHGKQKELLNHFHRCRTTARGTTIRARALGGAVGIKDGAMRNLARGMWTCAALYVAISLLGIFFLSAKPALTTSTDGYGISAIGSPPELR
jgi:hypothetical protein